MVKIALMSGKDEQHLLKFILDLFISLIQRMGDFVCQEAYQIIVADAADAVSVNFSGRCKFLQI